MPDKVAPCPNCGNDHGPNQMIQQEDMTWWCPSCHGILVSLRRNDGRWKVA